MRRSVRVGGYWVLLLVVTAVVSIGAGGQPDGSEPPVGDVPWRDLAAGRRKIVLGVQSHLAKGVSWTRVGEEEVEGFGIRVVVEAARAVGLSVEVVATRDQTAEEMLASGKYDAVTGVSVLEKRIGTMAFTQPIFLARGAVYSRSGTPVARDAEGLRRGRVVVARNGVGHEWCVEHGISVVPKDALVDAFESLRRGEADYVVTTMAAGRYDLEGLGVHDLVETGMDEGGFVRAFAVATRKEDASLVSMLNVGLEILESNGRYEELYRELAEKYQPIRKPPVVSARVVVWLAAGAGVLVVMLSLGYAVSSRRLARRTLEMRSLDEQLSVINATVPALIYSYFVGRDGTRAVKYVSPQAAAWREVFPSLELGKDYKETTIDWIHPDDRGAYEREVEKCRRELTRFDVVYRMKDASGEYRTLHSMVTPRPHEDGVDWHALLVDLSESTRAARIVREANERFEAIFEGSRDGIIVFRPENERVVAVNSRACEMYGYKREEFLSMSLVQLSTDVEAGLGLVKRVETVGWFDQPDWRQKRKDGTLIDVHLSGHMIEYGGERAVLSINRDVTEKKRNRRVAERERRVFLGGPTVVFRWANAPGYPVEHVSENVAQFGYTVEDLVSGRVSAATMVHPEDLQRVIGEAMEAERSGAASYESEYRILTKSGETRWVHDYTALVRDESGRTVCFEGCLTDQTNFRKAEEQRRQLERQLWHSQRVESLGVLVAGVAHDFNNLLVGMLGNAGLAKRQLDRPEEAARSLGRIEEAGKFTSELIQRLMGHSWSSAMASEPVDLAAIGSSMVDTLGPRVPRSITVKRLGGSAWARVDEVAVKQAVMNLLTNAADAIGGRKGEIVVRTGTREYDPSGDVGCCEGKGQAKGSYSFLCVEDSGGGISNEVRRRMFEPFASTGEEGHGLGLALVLSIVRRTGGVVSVRTQRGLGTWFELLWPSAATVEASPIPVAREGRLLLVVDDHAGVRSTACEMIRSLGYVTEEARSGEEGLEKIASHAPDAVLLDISLPGMSGWEVLERIREVAPGTRVILSSGHDVSRGTSRVRPDAYLPKPYMFDTLQSVLVSLVPMGEVEK